MKNRYVLFVMLFIFFSTVQIASAFTDVDSYTKYADAINFIASKNIVNGYPDGTYRSMGILNRAELLKIVVEAVYGNTNGDEIQSYSNQNCFNDVPANKWFTKYVCFAKAINIVSGYPDGTFKPEQDIIFVEALKITMNGFRYKYEETDPWYKGYVDNASLNNFIPLDVTAFTQNFNRGQMAELITRILKFQAGELNSYLGERANIIVTYDTIVNGLFMENSGTSLPSQPPSSVPVSPIPYTPKYTPTPYDFTGGTSDAYLGVGEKFRVSDDINIRIDSIDIDLNPTMGTRVKYSIWGKTSARGCSLISSTGEFWTNVESYKFREFTDSFLEFIEVSNMKVHIRQYYGNLAKIRCDEIAGWKKGVACSFYPRDNYVMIASGKFKMFFDKLIDQQVPEYYVDAFNNCYNLYTNKIPKLVNILPFNSFWKMYFGPLGAYSTDYERISISFSDENVSSRIPFLEDAVKNGKCPMTEMPIPHELTHALFATTLLQFDYDAGARNEVPGLPGISYLGEGLSDFLPYLVTKDTVNYTSNSKEFYDVKIQRCGKDSLFDIISNGNTISSGATDLQKKYSEILAGRGFNGQSNYDMGFCFYKRVEDTCGDDAILGMINKAIDEAGSLEAHSTMFKYLANYCGEDQIKSIMQDFGFDTQLLNVNQKNPNQGFPNDLNDYGCMQ